MQQETELYQHKRKVFFENLNPKTTTNSLRAYLSADYEMDACIVPWEQGKNKGHGFVIFSEERFVDALMARRPHQIDDEEVEIYRSVPHQGSLIENKGVTTLIVYGIENKLSKSDLKQYFNQYGSIDNIDLNEKENFSRIEFNDYDSVDKALLDGPHTIHQVEVILKKGSPNYRPRTTTSFKEVQIQKVDVISTVSSAKQVIIDSGKTYCMNITNLPPRIDADDLSKVFKWPIYDILMRPFSNEHSSSTECWLINLNNIQIADDFITKWNGKIISGSKIQCQYEEDTKELCKFFHIGICVHSDDACEWKHIMCPEKRTCSSSDCPYGHIKGLKTAMVNNASTETYRIKITGFQTKLTSELLAQLLEYKSEKQCYVKSFENQIGYIIKLKTIKSAKNLIEQWHNKEIKGGHRLKCQLELNIFPFTPKARCDYTTRNSRDSSTSRDDNEFLSTSENKNGARFDNDLIERQNGRSTESTTSSIDSKLRLPTDELDDQWEITKRAEGNGGQVLFIREKIDRKRLAIIKIYKTNQIRSYNNELKALQILKDINNVPQLIECSSNKNNSWIIMERVLGCSLKELINRKYHGDISVLEAMKFAQKLLIILKEFHSQGIFYRNLEPENLMIEWDSKKTSIDQAHVTFINFSQAYIKSNDIHSVDQQSIQKWYQTPQADVKEFEYSPTIDASDVCAIVFWLLTNIDPRHDHDKLPHQQNDARDKIESKTNQAVETANLKRSKPMKVEQLKTYLIDTFNIAFGYPEYLPWTIGDLECRLESICEVLSSTNPKLNSTERIFQELLSTMNTTISAPSIATDVHQDILEKASNAFDQAKKYFLESNGDQYVWSDGGCRWLTTAQAVMSEHRHDDILTFQSWNRGTSSSCSIIITCLATVSSSSGANIITLSIGSPINGKMCRIPIGRYGKSQNYITEFRENFIIELRNLMISICKERKAIHS